MTAATATSALGAARPSRTAWALHTAERYALVLLLVAMIVFFGLYSKTSDVFLSQANLRNIVANESVDGLAALAALIPLVAMRFDVSIGAVLGGASVLIAWLCVNHGWALGPAIGGALVAGGVIGIANGYVVAYIGANSFIITLGMATLVTGLVSLFSKDQTIVGVPQAILDFGNGKWLGVPWPTWLLIAVAVLVAYLLRYTVTGRQLLQVGSNERSARLVGIDTKRLVFVAFLLAGVLAAIAGALQIARTGSGNPGSGSNLTLHALAACFLGATTIRPGHFNVPGTLVGVFFVAIAVNGLTLAGATDWVDPVFNGLSVIVAVALSTVLARRRGQLASPF
jgi:ribose transport system permease protein